MHIYPNEWIYGVHLEEFKIKIGRYYSSALIPKNLKQKMRAFKISFRECKEIIERQRDI